MTDKTNNNKLGGGEDIELRSEEMHDILTRPPNILIRAGISVICIAVLLLLVGSYFFKYPDVVQGYVVITTENPPTWIVAKTSGKIMEWNCTDKSEVQPGQRLAVIENPAVTNDVYRLKEQLSHCTISDTTTVIAPEILTGNYELGTLQNSYSALVRAAINYNNFISYNATYKEKQAILTQIAGHNRYSNALEKQLELKREELKIAERAYEREKQLFERGVISRSEMDIAENSFLAMRQSIQQIQTTQISTQIEAGQLRESLSKLDTQYVREENSTLTELKSAYSELVSSIENWEQAYVLTAPKEGTVTFDAYWAQDQFINAGNKVLAVVSSDPGQIIGRIQSPASMSGKLVRFKEALEQGKSARTIKFDNKEDEKLARELFLLTNKPVLYVCNVDEASAVKGNAYVDAVREAIKDEDSDLLIVSAKIESEIAELETYEEREMFLQELGLSESGVSRLIKAAYKLLDLETYFTAGVQEVRAWTYLKGSKAPQCAGVIHTDFEKGFIRAEVIKYDDYIALGSESACKEQGKMNIEGKEYVVKDGDVMHFRFNV
jgi:Predicted GTPase, probable translation factor